MTSKIWDEKPASYWVHPTTQHKNYNADEIDEWLEKLKGEWGVLQNDAEAVNQVLALMEKHFEGKDMDSVKSVFKKAAKWDVISESHREYLGTGTYGALKKLEAIKKDIEQYYDARYALDPREIIQGIKMILEGEG